LRLPASAYAEVLVRPALLGQLRRARDAIRVIGITVDPLSAGAAESAAELRARHPGLRFADALVLGYAGIVKADLLLTTDRRLGGIDSRVEVVG
jgi:predicted nucleic acid-binding protein